MSVVAEVPGKIVGMVRHGDFLIVATETAVYRLDPGDMAPTLVAGTEQRRRWLNLRDFWARVWER
jgi:hypothetical protein